MVLIVMLSLVATKVRHLLLLLLLLLLLHKIGWNLLLESTIEGVPIHVPNLPCSYLKSLDFFSQGFIQSVSQFSLLFHGLQPKLELSIFSSQTSCIPLEQGELC